LIKENKSVYGTLVANPPINEVIRPSTKAR